MSRPENVHREIAALLNEQALLDGKQGEEQPPLLANDRTEEAIESTLRPPAKRNT